MRRIVFQHGEPSAVVLAHTETERWWGIERSLAAFHGLELYPELARDTSELAALIRGDVRPRDSAIRELGRRRRTILMPVQFVGVAALREQVAAFPLHRLPVRRSARVAWTRSISVHFVKGGIMSAVALRRGQANTIRIVLKGAPSASGWPDRTGRPQTTEISTPVIQEVALAAPSSEAL